MLEETKKEYEKIIKDFGVDKDKIQSLENKFNDIINKTTTKTEEVFSKQLLLDKYSQVEMTIKNWYRINTKLKIHPGIPLWNIINNKETTIALPNQLIEDLQRLTSIRNKIVHSKEVTISELNNAIFTANNIIEYFKKH